MTRDDITFPDPSERKTLGSAIYGEGNPYDVRAAKAAKDKIAAEKGKPSKTPAPQATKLTAPLGLVFAER